MITSLPPKLRRACSPVAGIVRDLDECLALPDEPALFRYAATVGTEPGSFNDRVNLGSMGGCSPVRPDAAAAAVGEAVERYSASYVPLSRVHVSTEADLDGHVVPVAAFEPFADAQYDDPLFPFVRATPEHVMPWVRGFRIIDGTSAWLPAELVFLGDLRASITQPTVYTTSTGTACAETLDDALVRGLCEVLERDAFVLAWMRRATFPRLSVDDHPTLADLHDRLFRRSSLRCTAVDLSSVHGIPSVLAVVRSSSGAPGAVGVGAGVASSVEEAWRKAVSEACSTRLAGAKLSLTRPDRDLDAGASVSSFDDHIQFHADPNNAALSAFLDASPESRPAHDVVPLPGSSAADWLDALLGRVDLSGHEAYAVDLTAPDVRELGLVVTKVLVPGLCMLDVSESARFLGPSRLCSWSSPYAVASGSTELNAMPHPFP
ncbi:unannotated protein [freshwater metagenome]|uniref:Unannotated protein n=1 Tax=freshwater metagenome TaxID=449393 RepID=A0A6J6PWW4_9ZZZZ